MRFRFSKFLLIYFLGLMAVYPNSVGLELCENFFKADLTVEIWDKRMKYLADTFFQTIFWPKGISLYIFV